MSDSPAIVLGDDEFVLADDDHLQQKTKRSTTPAHDRMGSARGAGPPRSLGHLQHSTGTLPFGLRKRTVQSPRSHVLARRVELAHAMYGASAWLSSLNSTPPQPVLHAEGSGALTRDGGTATRRFLAPIMVLL